MKQAVILGGSGFIGHHLSRLLSASGCKNILIIDLLEPREKFEGLRYVKADLRQPIPSSEVLEGATLYNLAAIHRTPGHADHEYFETNIPAAENAVSLCRAKGISRLVFTSSIAVYGPDEAEKTENSPLNPTSAYGQSKLEAEKIHQNWALEDQQNRSLAIVRPAVIFGRGEGGNFTRLAKTLKRRLFVYPGRKDTIKSCGYVGDLVKSFDFALDRAQPVFLYNFCYPNKTSIELICDVFHSQASLPRPLGKLPMPLLMGGARIFEGLDHFGLQNPVNRARILKLVKSTNISPQALVQANYAFPGDLSHGIAQWLGDGLGDEI